MKANQKLGNPAFFCSVLVLILNDWYLKHTFSNVITGKLSDFAGLFAFPFFLAALLPKHQVKIYVATCLLFILWKSPVIQPIINSLNHFGFGLNRTVDYTDYIALTILPFSWLIFACSKFYPFKPLYLNLLIIFSALAFLATSRVPGADRLYNNINKDYIFNFQNVS